MKNKLKLMGWNKFKEVILMEINVKSALGEQNKRTKTQLRRFRMGYV